jgi:hypothetical protein
MNNMKWFAILGGILMVVGCFTGAAIATIGNGMDGKADPDRDGLTNSQEFLWGTDPNNPSTDGSGIYDGWQVWYETHRAVTSNGGHFVDARYHFDPANGLANGKDGVVADMTHLLQQRDVDANVLTNDPDNDGLNNLHEFLIGTDPTNPDSDNDGLIDSVDADPLVAQPVIPDPTDGQHDGMGGGGSGIGEAVLFA